MIARPSVHGRARPAAVRMPSAAAPRSRFSRSESNRPLQSVRPRPPASRPSVRRALSRSMGSRRVPGVLSTSQQIGPRRLHSTRGVSFTAFASSNAVVIPNIALYRIVPGASLPSTPGLPLNFHRRVRVTVAAEELEARRQQRGEVEVEAPALHFVHADRRLQSDRGNELELLGAFDRRNEHRGIQRQPAIEQSQLRAELPRFRHFLVVLVLQIRGTSYVSPFGCATRRMHR